LSLWQWNEKQFLKNLEGSPIRRIGYHQWVRNLAIAIGNSHSLPPHNTIKALQQQIGQLSDLVNDHILWAISQHKKQLLSSKKHPKDTPNQHSRQKPFHAPKYYLPSKSIK
jgi:epoxyqueuosine reductase